MLHAQQFIRDACLLRGRDAKRLVLAAKIVVKEIQRQRVKVVVQFLAESVG
jgi:hypothetical protein